MAKKKNLSKLGVFVYCAYVNNNGKLYAIKIKIENIHENPRPDGDYTYSGSTKVPPKWPLKTATIHPRGLVRSIFANNSQIKHFDFK